VWNFSHPSRVDTQLSNACLPLRTTVNETARSKDRDCQTLLWSTCSVLWTKPVSWVVEFQRCRQLLCCWPTNERTKEREPSISSVTSSDAWNVVIGATTLGIDFDALHLYTRSSRMGFCVDYAWFQVSCVGVRPKVNAEEKAKLVEYKDMIPTQTTHGSDRLRFSAVMANDDTSFDYLWNGNSRRPHI
jgi:hypothetical protein